MYHATSVFALLLALGLPLAAWMFSPPRRGLELWLRLLASAALPFAFSYEYRPLRYLLAAFAVVYAAKAWEHSRNRVYDRRMWVGLPRFLLWWFIPPDTRAPGSAKEARAIRDKATKRLRRASFKAIALALLFVWSALFPSTLDTPLPHSAWSLGLTYTLITGLADLVCALPLAAGYEVKEVFHAPLLSTSPRDFWSHRWNRYVSTFARRSVFLPLGGARRPLRTSMLVFAMSGLMHEYLVLACGQAWSPYAGWTMAFFLLHGVATCAQGVLEHRRRVSSRAGRPRETRLRSLLLHTVWMVITGPLFFQPLDHAVGYSRWLQ